MNILFVLNHLPYPPRNGVTIPSYNLLAGLSRSHNVSLLFLDEGKELIDADLLEKNKNLMNHLWIVNVHKGGSKPSRLFAERLGKEIFHISGQYDISELKKVTSSESYDVVWISGETILNVTAILKSLVSDNVIFVAGLNDSISAPFRQAGKFVLLSGLRMKDRLFNAVKWLRSSRIAYIEKNILSAFDLILLQTEEDRKCVNTISDSIYDDRILIIPNGVNQDLFALDLNNQPKDKVILFIGILSGNYSRIVVWLIDKVWPLIKNKIPDAKFMVVGKGASEQLLEKISLDNSIEYKAFIPEIIDVYKGKSVAVLPVFKGFGLINKVIESMAAGVPVVGDKSSFNGIAGFVADTHGLVSEDYVEMANNVIKLLQDSNKNSGIAEQARQLVQQQFGWDDRVDKVNNAMVALHSRLDSN